MIQDNTQEKTTLEKWSIGLIIFGVLIFITSVIVFGKHRIYDSDLPIDINIFSGFGSFISGIIGTLISLVGVLLLISNLQEQKRNFIQQQIDNNDATKKQLIETRFFEYLKVVRENSENLYTKGYSGRRAMVEVNKEFNELFNYIKGKYTLNMSKKTKSEWQLDLINITYLIVFFGVDEYQLNFLKNLLGNIINQKEKDEFFIVVIDYFSSKHKKDKDENSRKIRSKRKYLEYDGHQNILGHYFRHIFQTINYIDSQEVLKYQEKYEYIKTLRAQLSTMEQLIFFYNSLSFLGRKWEFEYDEPNKKMITKYNLVKNITFELLDGISVKDFYSNVQFEGTEKSQSRIELERHYN